MVIDERAEGPFGPYFVNQNIGRLMLRGEIQRHPRRGYTSSAGWQTFAYDDEYSMLIWAAPGVPEMFRERKLGRVILPEGEQGLPVPRDWDDVLALYISGQAFAYDGDFYLLPRTKFLYNSFDYERSGQEPLSIFVGYRGHAHSYPLILTPSVLRDAGNDMSSYMKYKSKEGYAGNLLREAYWNHGHRVLQDLQACGILQHHKTIGNTDILDLSYEPDIAKAFALSDHTEREYVPKAWRDEEDYSYVYKFIVRVVGGTPKPIELPPPYKGSLPLLPFNICPLSSATELAERDRGFGVWGFGVNDADNFGMALNITELRYHPESSPHGWDVIGGPLLEGAELAREMTTRQRRELLGLPPEPRWLDEVLREVRKRVADRFDLSLPSEPIY